MYTEIAAAAASIKTFGELTTLILKAKVDTAVMEKAIESQSAIISLQATMLGLQAQQQALLTEKAELERRLALVEDWKIEAENYSLKDRFRYFRLRAEARGKHDHSTALALRPLLPGKAQIHASTNGR